VVKGLKLVFYAAAPLLVLCLIAILAGIVSCWLVQAMAIEYPLRKVISKATQLFLVLAIFPLMAWLKINKTELGFAAKELFFKQIVYGFSLGLVTLLPVILLLYSLGVNVIDTAQTWTIATLLGKMSLSLAAAMLIACLEESLFRGLLLSSLKQKMPLLLAILLSALYFAALHFLHSKTDVPLQAVTLASGFPLIMDAFANLLNPDISSAFWALFFVGVFLAVLRTQVKNSLGLCIGCHCCWVWQIKMAKSVFNPDAYSQYSYWVSSYDGIIGPMVSVWLSVTLLAYFLFRKLKSGKFNP
jgi:hypothetical protein